MLNHDYLYGNLNFTFSSDPDVTVRIPEPPEDPMPIQFPSTSDYPAVSNATPLAPTLSAAPSDAGGDVALSHGTFPGRRGVAGATASVATSTSLPDVGIIEKTSPHDFVGQGQFLIALSDTLAETPTTGETFVDAWGGIELRGLVDGLNVFNISEAQYRASNQIAAPDFDLTHHAVVINVAGRDIVYGSNGSLLAGQLNAPATYPPLVDSGHCIRHQRLLWNFHEAETLVGKGSLHGAILAPRAELTRQKGWLVGRVLGGDIDLRNTGRVA